MTLETVYYVGQTIAVAAILGSLVGIFFQMQQTNKITMFNVAKDVSEQFNELNSLFVTDASLRQALSKAGPLNKDEEAQVYAYVSMFCNVWLTIQMAHETGHADERWFDAGVRNVYTEIEKWPAFKSAAQEWLGHYVGIADLPIFAALRD